MSEVSLNEPDHRYEIHEDGELAGYAQFHDEGDVVVFNRTVVFEKFGGRGLAGQLIRFALDDMRTKNRTIDPVCSFVAGFIQKNPEYQVLMAGPSS